MLASRDQYIKYIYNTYGLQFALEYVELRFRDGILTPSRLNQERSFINSLYLRSTLTEPASYASKPTLR